MAILKIIKIKIFINKIQIQILMKIKEETKIINQIWTFKKVCKILILMKNKKVNKKIYRI